MYVCIHKTTVFAASFLKKKNCPICKLKQFVDYDFFNDLIKHISYFNVFFFFVLKLNSWVCEIKK